MMIEKYLDFKNMEDIYVLIFMSSKCWGTHDGQIPGKSKQIGRLNFGPYLDLCREFLYFVNVIDV